MSRLDREGARGRVSEGRDGKRQRAVAADLFDTGDSRAGSRSQSHSRSPDRRGHDYNDDDRHGHGHDRRRRRRSTSREEGNGTSSRDHKRRRRDHHHHHHHHHHRRHHDEQQQPPLPATLPFNARHLSYKHDFDILRPLFANYLDIQKGLDVNALDVTEQKGRWKSFVHKWNRGVLAEGWYDPEMFERIVKEQQEWEQDTGIQRSSAWPEVAHEDEDREQDNADSRSGSTRPGEQQRDLSPIQQQQPNINNEQVQQGEPEEEDDDDDYGPPPPPTTSSSTTRHGPGIPNLSDLALQRESAAEAQQAHFANMRLERKADRRLQKEQLDEVLPRAEPGTRERQLEKKKLLNEKMKGFREAAGSGEMEEVGDADLMGGGDADGIAEFKRAAAAQERKKTERELRREAEARARREEREKRLQEWREKEEEKLKGLKELAKARFG